jgi:hypothetical protein
MPGPRAHKDFEILRRGGGACRRRAAQQPDALLRVARAAAPVNPQIGERAHRIGVALVDGGAERRRDLCLVGRDIGAFVPKMIELQRGRDMTLLGGLAMPGDRRPFVTANAVAALQQARELVLRVAVAGESAAQSVKACPEIGQLRPVRQRSCGR